MVTIKSLDPAILQFTGADEQTVAIAAGGVGRSALRRGRPRDRPRARADDGRGSAARRDAFEDVDPGRGAGVARNRRGLRRHDERHGDARS